MAMLARRQAALDAMAGDIAGEGGAARGFAADLTDEAALRAALARVAAEMGPPEVLVYNASVYVPAAAMELAPQAFAAELALDVTGALIAAQAVFPAMQAAGRGTDPLHRQRRRADPERGGRAPGLTVGKTALRALALAIAPELARAGIHLATVTIAGTVAPGTGFDPAQDRRGVLGAPCRAPRRLEQRAGLPRRLTTRAGDFPLAPPAGVR